MVKSPAMQVVPASCKVAMSEAPVIVLLPGVTLPLQFVGEISVPQTPALQVGKSPLHFFTSLQPVPQVLVRFRDTSQALVVSPSQFKLPELHGMQTPELQVSVSLAQGTPADH